jgi:uncharacterized protein (TIGR02453 family)
MTDAPTKPFTGFSPKAFAFFKDLAANNSRDWFLENKGDYEAWVREPMAAVVGTLSLAFGAHDIPLSGDPKRSLFRLNRDIRFSKDKSPYKTSAGAVLSRDGTKDGAGLFYLHLGQPGEGFMACGFYGPDPKTLGRLRQGIVKAPEAWLKVESTLAQAGLALSTDGALTRAPRGFEAHADTALAPALRLKNLVVSRPLSDADMAGRALIDQSVAFAAAALPLLRFGWSALERCD